MAGKGKRDILRRIKAVKSTQQITKAMKLVAAAKLRRAQERVLASRPYARKLQEVLGRLAQAAGGASHPLLERREPRRVALVIVTADRGLCGSYNINVIRRATAALQNSAGEPVLIAVGRKGREFFARRGRSFHADYVGIGEEPSFQTARRIARDLMTMFLNRDVDQVRLVYTEFISALQQKPVEVQLLPVPREDAAAAPESGEGLEVWGRKGELRPAPAEYIMEPSPEAVLETLLPRFVETIVYRTLLEAKASEHGARMTAMGSATDNATKMIAKLTLQYNRARQAAITREIAEIVGGAAALT